MSFLSCVGLMFLCVGGLCEDCWCGRGLVCVGGLEALCCKGCRGVGLCGDGVVCWCEVVLGNYFGGGGVL